MTLTHWNRTDWADASGDAKAELGGLTDFGESVIKEMNRLGMIIDVSHAHDETFWDVIRVSSVVAPATRSLMPIPRLSKRMSRLNSARRSQKRP